jgi:hypothetical protein
MQGILGNERPLHKLMTSGELYGAGGSSNEMKTEAIRDPVHKSHHASSNPLISISTTGKFGPSASLLLTALMGFCCYLTVSFVKTRYHCGTRENGGFQFGQMQSRNSRE